MDIFDIDMLNDWDLETFCAYEQDKNALRRKEREKRSQEAHQSDTFKTDFPLFSEPYKTNKDDELSSRIQNTLGNYDEMRDFLTDQLNQSHLVGIPKNKISHSLVEKTEQNLFSDSRNIMQNSQPNNNSSTPSVLPPSISSLIIPYCPDSRKLTMDLPQKEHNSASGYNIESGGHLTKNKCGDSRNKVLDSYSSQNEHKIEHQTNKEDPEKVQPLSPKSLHSGHQSCLKSMSSNHSSKRHQNSKFSCEANIHSFAQETQASSVLTKHTNNALYAQNLPPSLSSKPSAIQQKPTAYVRPMDGQDQASNESPEIKQSVETDISYSEQSYGGLSDAKIDVPAIKAMKARLTIPLSKEVDGSSGNNSSVEEILRKLEARKMLQTEERNQCQHIQNPALQAEIGPLCHELEHLHSPVQNG